MDNKINKVAVKVRSHCAR